MARRKPVELEPGWLPAFDPVPKLTLYLHYEQLQGMSEYSTTVPTGTTIGKFWKRNEARVPGVGWQVDGANPEWVVCCYAEHYDPAFVRILVFEVVLLEGPPPRTWRKPDWSYFSEWQRVSAEQRAQGGA